MKKQNLHFSIAKTLFLLIAILFSYSHSGFAQENENDNAAQTEAQENNDSEDHSSSEIGDAERGKELLQINCAACHHRYNCSTGHAFYGSLDRAPSRQWLYDWIHNSTALINAGDPYANQIYDEYNQMHMTHFPQLSESDIDDILAYTEQPKPEPKVAETADGSPAGPGASGGISNIVVLGILALLLLLLVVILALVNKTLTRFAEEKGITIHREEKVKRKTPLWKLVVENQFIVVVFSIVVLLIGSY